MNPPINQFNIEPGQHPVVLIAAGIGITPIKPMASSLAKAGREYALHYAGQSRNTMPYLNELLSEHGNQLHLHISSEQSRLSLSNLLTQASDQTVFYLCGPQALIAEALGIARVKGIAADRIRFEKFV